MKKDLQGRIETFAKLPFKCRYPVFFTGAGISAESGLSDFRGPDGMWTRRDKGLAPKPGRPWDSVEPNSGHMALAELQKVACLRNIRGGAIYLSLWGPVWSSPRLPTCLGKLSVPAKPPLILMPISASGKRSVKYCPVQRLKILMDVE